MHRTQLSKGAGADSLRKTPGLLRPFHHYSRCKKSKSASKSILWHWTKAIAASGSARASVVPPRITGPPSQPSGGKSRASAGSTAWLTPELATRQGPLCSRIQRRRATGPGWPRVLLPRSTRFRQDGLSTWCAGRVTGEPQPSIRPNAIESWQLARGRRAARRALEASRAPDRHGVERRAPIAVVVPTR